MGSEDRIYKYKQKDGSYIYGLTYKEAQDKEDEEKKLDRVSSVMDQLDQMASSGNYSLEGAYTLAARNRVADDPNVQAYIKNMADDMVNKNAREQFGFDQQFSGNMPAQAQQTVPSSGNTLSSWSSGTPDFNPPTLSPENEQIAQSIELDKNAAPWSSQSNSSGSGNTVASALSGNQSQPSSSPQQQQNDFLSRLPNEMQQYIKRSGLSESMVEGPVREYLIKKDGPVFLKAISALVKEQATLESNLRAAEEERNLNFTRDLYGKAPITGPDGSQSFTTDDAARGKVSFDTRRLESPISRSEHKSYNYSSGGGGGQTNEGLIKLMSDRTEFIKSLNESELTYEQKTNAINQFNAFIDQEAKRSGYSLPKVLDKSVVKWFNDASTWLEEQKALPEKKRHPGYAAALNDYNAKKAEYGIIE